MKTSGKIYNWGISYDNETPLVIHGTLSRNQNIINGKPIIAVFSIFSVDLKNNILIDTDNNKWELVGSGSQLIFLESLEPKILIPAPEEFDSKDLDFNYFD